jgi:hypothetical protein
MNHHGDKLLLDGVESNPDGVSKLVEAYSCPHCGTNAGRTVQDD